MHPTQTTATAQPPIVLAITGASGAVYGARLLQLLLEHRRTVHLVVSSSGAAVIRQELGVSLSGRGQAPKPSEICRMLSASDHMLALKPTESMTAAANAGDEAWLDLLKIHAQDDYFTPVASGSFLTGGMVICPCSGSTLSGIARSASQNLVQRAAEVHLKENRKLIVVPRETPLSVFQLENMHRLAQAGVVVLPAAPGWYHGVGGLVDLVDFVIARILDQLGIVNQQIRRWEPQA